MGDNLGFLGLYILVRIEDLLSDRPTHLVFIGLFFFLYLGLLEAQFDADFSAPPLWFGL